MPAPSSRLRKPLPAPGPSPAPRPKPKAVPAPSSAAPKPAPARPAPRKPSSPTPLLRAADKRHLGGCLQIARQKQRVAKKQAERGRSGRVFGERGDGPMKVLKEMAMHSMGLAFLLTFAQGAAQIVGRLAAGVVAGVGRYVPEIETARVRSNDAVIARNREARLFQERKASMFASGDGSSESGGGPRMKPASRPAAAPGKTAPRAGMDARVAQIRQRAREMFDDPDAFAKLADLIEGKPVPESMWDMLRNHNSDMAAYVMRRDPSDFGPYRQSFEFSTQTMRFPPEVAAASIYERMQQAVRMEGPQAAAAGAHFERRGDAEGSPTAA